MIGIILAAGVGSRLRPMTNTKPKCLVTTAGQAILQYQIDAYQEAGIKELIIVVGYEGAAIKDYCKHIKEINIKIIENTDYETTNNMYSLYLTKNYVAGRQFILNNADLSIDKKIVNILAKSKSDNAIAVDTSLYNEESMKISISEDGYISNISKSIKEQDAFACSIDFYKFSAAASKAFFEEISKIIEEEKNLKDWTEVAMQRLFQSQKLKFKACDISGLDWVEIDNYDDLALSDRKFSKYDEKAKEIDNILFDLDGTIYVGGAPIMGAAEAIKSMQALGKNIYFLTNNSSKNKNDYVAKLTSLGIHCTESQIVLSSDGLLEYLRKNKVERVHALGTNSLKKSLMDHGINIDSANPEYVVIGYDTELNYQKLMTACKYINEGTDILATHCDIFCPSEYGPIPDIGALLEMIRITTGKTPKKVFGKPNMEMIEPLISKFNLNPQKTLIVGDRLHTDILMSKKFSCYGLLVLTGDSTRDQVEDSKNQPDFILKSVKDMPYIN
ncbi:HAD-IIA family hydrolase [Vandammella animalimorsus]|uniref:HAD-IIA family hydrolase n=1 Tax=Vandammella animalimorsus TaxID=2029117 RepID=A0A3M6R706_9BURK|nr:HAD-IIA family hydrolase [Vandammella animalimorsus]RMX11136.1 HAD-IIA family hydrolase [Vandammella animalimorsus]